MSKSLFKSKVNTLKTRIQSAEDETFNLTHLTPMKEWARNRSIHRDMNAHCLRWQYAAMVLFKMRNRSNCSVLDIGCSPDWPLLITFHSNASVPGYFLGIDARDCSKGMPVIKHVNARFEQCDVSKGLPKSASSFGENSPEVWNMITCFEVIEHMPKDEGIYLLDNIKNVMSDETMLLFSTPCYDEKVGQADNHIYEYAYDELKEELEKRFTIEDCFGTFISQADYVPSLSPDELKMFHRLKQYYNSAWISNIFAVLFPEKSRNCLWVLKRK